jgi:LacI family transcriptional regulator
MGFVESLINHDVPVSDAIMINTDETATGGYTTALDMLRDAATRPTALVCFNDMVAMGAYRAANELGLTIPGDISITGFDGIDFAELLGPPLTSVDIAPRRLGELAAEMLVKKIRNEMGRNTAVEWIEPKLLERASVRRLGVPVAAAI